MRTSTTTRTSRTGSALGRDGYTVLAGLVGAAELDELRAAVARRLATPVGASCERPHNTLVPLRWSDAPVDVVLRSAERRERIADAVDASDLRLVSGYVSVKEPHSRALWWHQDWWCWSHPVSLAPVAPQVALLVYLADTSPRNGALRVIPGSHRGGLPLHRALPTAHDPDGTDLGPEHPAMADHPDALTPPVRGGDAVLADYRVLHGTHPNATARRRDCLLLTFAPGWASLPPEIRGHLICHPALPGPDERPPTTGWPSELLPSFDGPRRSLPLDRVPPPGFRLRA